MSPSTKPIATLVNHVSRTFGGRVDGERVLYGLCYRMLLEMMALRKREVIVKHDEPTFMSLVDSGEPVLRAESPENDPDQLPILVLIDTEERIGVKWLRSNLDKYGDKYGLVAISVEGPTPFSRKEACASNARIEFFAVKELLINPMRHSVSPSKIESLDEEETRLVMAEHCMLFEHFPILLSTDIVCRWFNFRVGTVVRIERRGFGSEAGVHYRRIV